MNWSRCSEVAAAALILLVATAGVVGAVSVTGQNVPGTAKEGTWVGDDDRIVFTLGDEESLYTDYDSWTLVATTGLRNATWTVTLLDNKGTQIDQYTETGGAVDQEIGGDIDQVRVRLEGRIPVVDSFQYEPAQKFVLAQFNQAQPGGASQQLKVYRTRHYTTTSRQARQAIQSAAAAVNATQNAGADASEAEQLLGNAVSAFESEDFDNAESLASQAEQKAEQSRQAKQRGSLFVLLGGGAAGILVVGGLVYWFLNRRETYDELG